MKRYVKSATYVKAAFSPSIPDWLKKSMPKRGWNPPKFDKFSIARLGRESSIAWDRAKFVKIPPESGHYQAFYLLKDGSYDQVYAPGLLENFTIRINGRERDPKKLGKETLLSVTKDIVYVDLDDPSNLIDIPEERYRDPRYHYEWQSNDGQYAGQYKDNEGRWSESGASWRNDRNRDKSGYTIPSPSEMLGRAIMNFPQTARSKVDKLYIELQDLRDEILSFDIRDVDRKNYSGNYERAIDSLSRAIGYYRTMLTQCFNDDNEFKPAKNAKKYGEYDEYELQDFLDYVNKVKSYMKDARNYMAHV